MSVPVAICEGVLQEEGRGTPRGPDERPAGGALQEVARERGCDDNPKAREESSLEEAKILYRNSLGIQATSYSLHVTHPPPASLGVVVEVVINDPP